MQNFPNYFDQGTLSSKAYLWDLVPKEHTLKNTRLVNNLRDSPLFAVFMPWDFHSRVPRCPRLGRRITLVLGQPSAG